MCGSVVAHGLEVVRGCVIRDVRSELDRLHVGCAEVEPRPDACLDDFVDRLREAAERARRGPAGVHEAARDLVAARGCVAEEHPQHGRVRAVEPEVSRWVVRVRCGDQRRPRRVRRRRGVVVQGRLANRLERPPEVEVVLVVPGVDRRVRCREVFHREKTGGVRDVQIVPGDELAGDVVPARNRVALPPLRDVRLRTRTGRGCHDAVAADRLHFVEVSRPGGAGKRRGTGASKLRRALHQERLDATDPGGGSCTVVPFGATGSQWPAALFGTH